MKKLTTLKSKLICTSVIMLVVSVIVNLAIGIGISYKALEYNVERDLKSIGETSQIAISNTLNQLKEKITDIGSLDTIRSASQSSSWISTLENKAKNYGYTKLYVVTSNGKIISSDSAYNGKDVSNADYFKQAYNGKAFISTTEKDANGQLAIFASAPVSNGNFDGIVIGEMDVQTYSNIIKNIVIGKTGNVFMIDKTGTLIANIRPQLVAQQSNFIEMAKTNSTYQTSAVVFQKMISGKTGVDQYAYETGARICYYEPLPGTDGWSCGVVAPVSEMMSSVTSIIIGMAIASVVLIILGIFFSSKFAQKISMPLQKCSERLVMLSKGDIHSEVPVVKANDETGDLAKATSILVTGLQSIIQDETYLLTELANGNFNVESKCDHYTGDLKPIKTSIEKIIDSLNGTFHQMGQSADQVAGGSEQVSGGAQLLAQGATEQAGSVEELSVSIKNLSNEIQSNADSASRSNEKAEKVKNELRSGSEQMQTLTQAMEQIRSSSAKISMIIKSIQDIAFQTNILALNAAVEAARAGEAGKGFSVVADEVRNLAGKSAQASKQTSDLITGMTEAVENGTGITNSTEETLLSIVDDTKDIITTVNEISDASQKQADSIKQVTQNMEQISAVIQTNSATAEESAAASEELSGQANDMKQLIGRFQLRQETEETTTAE